jgi:prepilin-type N-terminal cleavage/methylation domain-containing protein
MKTTQNKKGFTLIETLVAITILLLSVVLPMSLSHDGIVAARLSQDQIVSFYLAQEGLELVRNVRDENKFAGVDLLDGPLSACEVDPNNPADIGCTVDATRIIGLDFDIQTCGSGCPNVYTDGNKYTHRTSSGYFATKYKREVRVWYVTPPSRTEAIVEVVVTWPFLTGVRSYTLRDNLLAW